MLRQFSLILLGRTVATLAIGAAGGWIASQIGIPLPWMIGALIAVGICALFDLTVIGHGVHVPQILRSAMVPVVGVMIGSTFTPEILGQIPQWWITMLGLVVFILASTAAVHTLYRRVFRYDSATAYFSAVPGGLILMAVIGEDSGGDPRTISLVHFCRIVLAVLIIPFVMRMIYGPVGSSVLGTLHLGEHAGIGDLVLLGAAAAVGAIGGHYLRLPGAVIAGPMLVSAAIHVSGVTHAVPPNWLVFMAQFVIGAALGARFAGITLRQLGHIVVASVCGVATILAIGGCLALSLAPFVPEHLTALILAYAPGGFAEMSLVALSLQMGVAFVAAHHMVRIILAVTLMPALWRRVLAPRSHGPAAAEGGGPTCPR